MEAENYDVILDKKILKNVEKLPLRIQKKLNALILELIEKGPIRYNWPNYSKLSKNKFHCHLDYHWVACWELYNNQLTIEVYYVGTREKAPY
jgi:mRNA-degrading endonuclease RelE of RelBE toxin-antitoxin system